MLKRSLGLYLHPLVEYIVNAQPVRVQIRGNVAAETGYNHVSPSLAYPRGGRSEMDWDPEGQLRGYDMTSLQTVPCHIAAMLALFCWKRKLFPTV